MSDLSFLRMSSDRGCSRGRKIAHQPSGGRLRVPRGTRRCWLTIKTNLSSSKHTAPTVEYKPSPFNDTIRFGDRVVTVVRGIFAGPGLDFVGQAIVQNRGFGGVESQPLGLSSEGTTASFVRLLSTLSRPPTAPALRLSATATEMTDRPAARSLSSRRSSSSVQGLFLFFTAE
jgi:hypothetical protein